VEWDHLISRPDALEYLKTPGTLQLLSGQDDSSQTNPGWTEAHLLLCKFLAMGLHRLPDICDGNTIVLPTTISEKASPVCRRVLNRVSASRGSSVRWVDMTPPTRAILPGPRTPYLIRPGDTGQALVGGHVRLKSKGVTKTGTITAYDNTTSQYSIEFQDFSIQTWTLIQVKQHWKTRRQGDSWSESDKRFLHAQIRRIWGRSERACPHTTQTPFPSLLQSTEWIETETRYTCDMKWSIPVIVRTYTGTSGKRHDKALAEELCDLQAVFWALRSTWRWKSTSGSNRAGWMVQAISHREEDGDVLLNVRSLNHSDHHKHGDIRVTSSHGRPSIRSIIQLHDAREREGGLRISLSATEIGDPTSYSWVGKPPYTQTTCPGPIATPRDQSPRPRTHHSVADLYSPRR
jgi:hypothetical protein